MTSMNNIEWLKSRYRKFSEEAEIIRKAIIVLSENEEYKDSSSEHSSVNRVEKPLPVNGDKYPEEPLSITNAVRWVFNCEPDKKFNPKEMVKSLESFRKKKLLKTQSDNLLNAIGSPIKRLIEADYIERIGGKRKRNVKYRKKVIAQFDN